MTRWRSLCHASQYSGIPASELEKDNRKFLMTVASMNADSLSQQWFNERQKK
jgi:hypothetical protein